MKSILNLVAVGSLALLVSAGSCSAQSGIQPNDESSVPAQQGAPQLVAGNNQFALELYLLVAGQDGTGNIFFSPFSISSALGMTYTGARGETASQMASVMHFPSSAEETGRGFHSLYGSLSSVPEVVDEATGEPFMLAVSNGIWVQEGFHLLDEFVSEVTQFYSAAAFNLDLSGDAEGSREAINQWVAEKTMNRIQDLLPPGVLNMDTRMVLTNAVYFKASWKEPFDEAGTSDASFRLSSGTDVTVPMMNQTEFFRYAATEGCQAVELDYAGGNVSMLVILPDGDLEDFQDDLDSRKLETIRTSLSSINISLSMPRFEFTDQMQLGQSLISMGMERAFSPFADFSGITGGMDLMISEVVHKAFVKVDEAGTEAAAATAVVMAITAMPPTPVEMVLNRPFMFFILDRGSGSIIFMGRVMDPRSQ